MARYYLGLDVHKIRTPHCLVDEDGCLVGELWTCDAVACKIMQARMDYYYDLCR